MDSMSLASTLMIYSSVFPIRAQFISLSKQVLPVLGLRVYVCDESDDIPDGPVSLYFLVYC